MSPRRDFTDEHKRTSIPTMELDDDPTSPFCTDLNLVSRGPVAQMRLPPDWVWGERQDSGAQRFSYQNLHKADDESVLICFFYRGYRLEDSVAQEFDKLLHAPIHELSPTEIASIADVLQDKADESCFQRQLTKAKTLNGKRILVVEGFFKHIEEGRLALYFPADESGSVIQEIFYQAPAKLYKQNRQSACNAFDSIVWRS